jgi:hypothetical protein
MLVLTKCITKAGAAQPPSEADAASLFADLQYLDLISIDDPEAKRLSDTELHRLKKLILEFHILWDRDALVTPAATTVECDIELTEPALPSMIRARRGKYNPAARTEIAQHVKSLKDKGIIRDSCSPYSSTVLLVPKAGGGTRFVIDFRALNRIVKRDSYPLPRVEESLSALHGKKVFSSIDIVTAFWQVPLSKRSVELTAFTTPDGSYEWVRMPMGLSTASGVFSKFIDEVFSGLKWHVVLTYIDDCLIYSGTFEEHLAALRAVFERLRDHGLTLGAEKCHLCTSSVRFLGHLVTADGIRPDPIKIDAIQDWKMPTDKKSLQSTLGFFNYYRRFCKNYSSIAQPLNVLLKDKTKLPLDQLTGAVVWTPDQLKSFEILKSTLLRDAVLAHPDFTQPFIIDTDACAHGLGAVLSQRVGDRTMPVAFSSRSLTPAERAYTVWELETLAVYWACTIYNWYLWNQ